MSYEAVGSYYEFSPHQVYSGYGSYYEIPMSGYGSYYEIPMSGFGTIAPSFNANEVWADVQLGGSCYTSGNPNYFFCSLKQGSKAQQQAACGKCNAAGGRAANMIRAGLNEIGYGPLVVGSTAWTEGNPGSAWKKFLTDHSLPIGPGLGVTLQGLMLMEKLLKEGAKPGPSAPVVHEKVNGEFIPVSKTGIAGMSTTSLLLGALVVGGLGYAAYKVSKKKRSGGASMRM